MDLFAVYKSVLADLSVELQDSSRVLDWGCGAGALVSQGRAAGVDMYGCDFDTTAEHCSKIEQPYRLPFPDGHFDVVISNQVLEHVMDYDTSLAELRRVTRPGGAFLHMFPSRGMPIEPHVFVPLATVLRTRAWLSVWARLGVRNEFQREMTSDAVAMANHAYLHAQTNYLSQSAISAAFRRHFGEVRFVESTYLPHSPSRVLRKAASFPGAGWLYRRFHGRVLFGRHGAAM